MHLYHWLILQNVTRWKLLHVPGLPLEHSVGRDGSWEEESVMASGILWGALDFVWSRRKRLSPWITSGERLICFGFGIVVSQLSLSLPLTPSVTKTKPRMASTRETTKTATGKPQEWNREEQRGMSITKIEKHIIFDDHLYMWSFLYVHLHS